MDASFEFQPLCYISVRYPEHKLGVVKPAIGSNEPVYKRQTLK